MRRFSILSCGVFISAMLIFSHVSFSAAIAKPTHLDRGKVQKTCSGCHKGHGKRGTPLLNQSKDEFCFSCHSLSGGASDIYSEITKASKHRVIETARYHVPGEDLPERNPSQQRHVSCYDCHNVHKSDKLNKVKGMRGYSGRGAKLKKITREFQLCYNCHADSENIVNEESNISLLFFPSNPSFHPVESFGRNSFVPSLKREYNTSSIIDCSDCHGNDNVQGPAGPHGSVYEPILRFRYNRRTPSPESPSGYALCYACHERSSILADESFRAHKTHTVYNQISCAVCHNAHGSKINPALIEFDIGTVFPNVRGELTYMPAAQGRPQCFLSCHVNGQIYDHALNRETLAYCVNEKCPPEW